MLCLPNCREAKGEYRALEGVVAASVVSSLQAEKAGKNLLCEGAFFEIIRRTCNESSQSLSLRRRIPLFVLLALCLPCRLMAWSGQSVTLAWDAGQGTKGTGYYIYYGNAPRTYSSKIDVGSMTSATVSGLQAGATYYFATTAYNGEDIESSLSNEAMFIAPTNPVVQPSGPQIQVVNPGSASVGQQVNIYGANFSTVSNVQFQGINASFSTASNSVISALVPAGATSGSLIISTPYGTASSPFAVLPTFAPANDNFASAQVLQGTIATASANTAMASKEVGEPYHAGKAGGRSVWYRWTAPSGGAYSLDARGSDFTALLGVYIGSALTTLTTVGSNSVGILTFNATAGATYQIAVDGLNAAAGNMVLRLMPVVSTTTIYSTSFETTEGFAAGQPTAGRNGWLSTGSGGSSIMANAFVGYGQQASIAATSTKPASNSIVFRPLSYTVDPNTRPIVQFSVLMQINNPLSRYRDSFGWAVRNTSGKTLFSILLSNADGSVKYEWGDGPWLTSPGVTFGNGALYTLLITMDFSRNRWSAWLGGVVLAVDQPMTTPGGTLTLGDIGATLTLDNPTLPSSDNMVFDNYVVTAGPSGAPKLLIGPQNQTLQAGSTVTLTAAASGNAPLSYGWYYNNQSIPGATNASLLLAGISSSDSGNYSVVVRNASGSATGNALVTVTNPPPKALFASAGRSGNNGMALNLSLAIGNNYRLQCSTNLSDWSTLYALHATGTNLVWLDPGSTNFNRRFYRVASP
ncbi:MAG: hypothetical protein JWR26_1525 [Pedosphaera sp.]|nr:hypothetical protein [Pedosphaera sp.]